MAWTTPADWTAGEKVTASKMNTHVRDNELYLYALATASFTSFTPTATNLTIGNGTLAAKYIQAMASHLIVARYDLIWGSTTSASGNLSLSLPGTATTGSGSFTVGFGEAIDSSTSAAVPVRGRLTSSTTFTVLYGDNAGVSGTVVNATGPWTWATSDELHLIVVYEAA